MLIEILAKNKSSRHAARIFGNVKGAIELGQKQFRCPAGLTVQI